MAGISESIPRRLERLLGELVRRQPLRQAIIGLETGDRSFSWTGAVGAPTPDGTPPTADTPFFLASIDKLLNATIALRLSERRQLDLDARVTAYLPASVTRGLHRFGGTDYSDQITVRHLLSHTSGLADWLEDRPRGGRSLVDRAIEDGDMALDIDQIAAIVRDELQPHFPPQDLAADRQKIRYSDTNYMLLIAIIEAVTGQPLHQVHEALLFQPLDLRHTWFVGQSEPVDPTPEPPVLRADGRPLAVPLLLRSLRGIYSTAGDLLAFLRALVQGRVFDQTTTLASMQARWNRFGLPLDRAALRAPGWPIQYGLGIMRFQLPRVLTPWHRLPPVVGHTGSTGCWLFYCPEWDLFLTGSVDEATAGAVPFRIVPKMLAIWRTRALA